MDSSISIRRCRSGDEVALSLVGQAAFLEAFAGVIDGRDVVQHCLKQHSIEKYEHYLHDANSAVWIAEAGPGAAPVGYLVLTTPDLPLADLDSRDLEVKRIYLLHRYQGGGIGRALMDAARDYARGLGTPRLLLGVYSKNESAVAFYERIGYVKVGTRSFHVGTSTYHDFIFALPVNG